MNTTSTIHFLQSRLQTQKVKLGRQLCKRRASVWKNGMSGQKYTCSRLPDFDPELNNSESKPQPLTTKQNDPLSLRKLFLLAAQCSGRRHLLASIVRQVQMPVGSWSKRPQQSGAGGLELQALVCAEQRNQPGACEVGAALP